MDSEKSRLTERLTNQIKSMEAAEERIEHQTLNSLGIDQQQEGPTLPLWSALHPHRFNNHDDVPRKE